MIFFSLNPAEYEDESDYEYVDEDYDDADDEDNYDDYRNKHGAYENIRNVNGIDTRYNKMWKFLAGSASTDFVLIFVKVIKITNL
jgi:hypothetical protein